MKVGKWHAPWRNWVYFRRRDLLLLLVPVWGLMAVDDRMRGRWEIANFPFNHGIVVVRDLPGKTYEVLHFVGYEEEPTPAHYEDLKAELLSDPTLGLVHRRDWRLTAASPAVIGYYKELINS